MDMSTSLYCITSIFLIFITTCKYSFYVANQYIHTKITKGFQSFVQNEDASLQTNHCTSLRNNPNIHIFYDCSYLNGSLIVTF